MLILSQQRIATAIFFQKPAHGFPSTVPIPAAGTLGEIKTIDEIIQKWVCYPQEIYYNRFIYINEITTPFRALSKKGWTVPWAKTGFG
ncbi:MAG: hypothetical protein HFE39_09880 [Clostridiales bacterium]|jgi:hypothetical protein|nr:hypothetical protein [Clostridiales bacterium]